MIQFKSKHLTVFQSALYMTTTAIIEANDVVVMTDPNWLPSEIEVIKEYITKQLGNRQLYIIYTHSDFDHIIGAGAFPEAKVIASERFTKNPNKEEILQTIHQFDQSYYLSRNYDMIYPNVDIVIKDDGHKIELGELTLTFYLAPGHTEDGLFTVVEPYGIFLAGDYLSDVEFPFLYSSYEDYVHTINKAETIFESNKIATLVPGHGTTTQNQNEIKKRINIAKDYLERLPHDNGELESFLQKKYKFFEGMKSNHLENKRYTESGPVSE